MIKARDRIISTDFMIRHWRNSNNDAKGSETSGQECHTDFHQPGVRRTQIGCQISTILELLREISLISDLTVLYGS
jgi:hypothetical protein